MSWKPEIEINGKWERNWVRFATLEEAEAFAKFAFHVWFGSTDYRVVEVNSDIYPANYKFNLETYKLESLP